MKIIMIPNGPVMSGRHYCLAKELQAKGHEVTYFMWQHPLNLSRVELFKHLFTSLIPKSVDREAFVLYKAIRLPFFWPIVNGWIFKLQLKRIYKQLDADLIISQSFTNETEIPRDLPFIYDLADDYAGPGDIYGSPIYKTAFKLLGVRRVMHRQCKNALAVTTVSSKLFNYAKKLNANTLLLPNGVEQNLIEEVLSKQKATNPHSIIYATGFGPWSRALETLKTVTDLRKEFPDIALTLVGSGTEVPKIKQYIADNDANKYITYIDYIYDRSKLFELLANHAIGLNISDKNAWRDASHPMKVMDYSALGMKVVSTNLTEVERLGYENLYIFSDNNKRKSFKVMLRKALKDNHVSYDNVSSEVCAKYSWSSLVSKLTELAMSVLPSKPLAAERHSLVHVSYAYPPAVGGLEQVVQQLANSQAQQGVPVSVMTSAIGWTETTKADSLPITRLKYFIFANTTIMPGLFWKLLHLNKNDIVHLHIVQAFSPEIVWLASKIRGFRYVAHLHLDTPPSGWAGFLLRIYKPVILGRVLRAADGVAVFTKDQKKDIGARYHLNQNNVHVVPNGVATDFYMQPRRQPHRNPHLLFVGRLSYQKNLAQLLDALDGISEQFETTIVGDGELRLKLESHARRLQLKNVTFTGSLTGEALLAQYKYSDIFVLPSEREGMPLVLLEAMAAGLPVIATRVTGNKDIVKHRKNGLLVPYGNAKALQTALLKLATDKSLYGNMSRAAVIMAQSFTWTAVRERFAVIYPRPVEPSKTINAVKGGRTVSLPKIMVSLLFLAVAAYVIPNIIGSSITLLFFLTVPGYLLLRRIIGNYGGWWEQAGLSVVLSLLVIMVGGLLLNTLHYAGLVRPLSTHNIFIMLSVITLFLIWLNRKAKLVISLPKLKNSSKTFLITTILLSLLPVLAIGGAIRLNNGASNILTMILFSLIVSLFVVLLVRKELRPLYPYALFVFAISILLSTSLRGSFITGHDIRHEFQVFMATNSRELWLARVATYDPYNSCLSITILPTILYKVTHISAEYIYKAVFQIVFAFGIVPIFYVSRKFLAEKSALVAGFIVITFPIFINDLTYLNRQEIAFLFFISLMSISFSQITKRPKYFLTFILLLGILLSHYSTNYVTVGLLVASFIIYRVITFKRSVGTGYSIPILSISVIVSSIFATYTWGTLITQTSPNAEHTFTRAVHAVENGDTTHSSTTKYGILKSQHQSPQQIFTIYAGNQNNDVSYVEKNILPLTHFGTTLNRFINVRNVNNLIHSSIAKAYQIMVILGVAILFVRNIYIQRDKQLRMTDVYLTAIACGSVLLLILLTILPYVSVSYDVGRLFMQSLVITAIPIVVAGEFIFRLTRRATYATAILFIIVFLFISGFIPQLTGGYDPKIALANSGTYYNFFYEHRTDKAGSQWLADNRDKTKKVFLDTDSSTKPPFFVSAGLLLQDSRLGYVYESYSNVTANTYRAFPNGELIEYSDKRVTQDRNLLYTNQGSAVYSPTYK